VLDISKFLSSDRSSTNDGQYEDRALDGLYHELVREPDPVRLKEDLRRFERRVLDEQTRSCC
jgi:hypothetical protein